MVKSVLVSQRDLLRKATQLEVEQDRLGKAAEHEHGKKILKLAAALRLTANAMQVAGYDALFMGLAVEHAPVDRRTVKT